MVVVAIVSVLAVIALPNFVKARTSSYRTACIENLRMIEAAKASWAAENKKMTTDSPADSELFGATRYLRNKLSCPGNGVYTIDTVQNLPTCSYGVSDGHTL